MSNSREQKKLSRIEFNFKKEQYGAIEAFLERQDILYAFSPLVLEKLYISPDAWSNNSDFLVDFF